MQRIEAIKKIMSSLTNEVVITSLGFISREVHQVKDRARNFYCMGSMGMALALGLGIAQARPELKVIVFSGDGAMLMSLGTLVLHKDLVSKGMTNLTHYILDNNCHASTGGQPTCSNSVDFRAIGAYDYTRVIEVTKEKGDAPRIPLSPKEIARRFKDAIIRKQKE